MVLAHIYKPRDHPYTVPRRVRARPEMYTTSVRGEGEPEATFITGDPGSSTVPRLLFEQLRKELETVNECLRERNLVDTFDRLHASEDYQQNMVHGLQMQLQRSQEDNVAKQYEIASLTAKLNSLGQNMEAPGWHPERLDNHAVVQPPQTMPVQFEVHHEYMVGNIEGQENSPMQAFGVHGPEQKTTPEPRSVFDLIGHGLDPDQVVSALTSIRCTLTQLHDALPGAENKPDLGRIQPYGVLLTALNSLFNNKAVENKWFRANICAYEVTPSQAHRVLMGCDIPRTQDWKDAMVCGLDLRAAEQLQSMDQCVTQVLTLCRMVLKARDGFVLRRSKRGGSTLSTLAAADDGFFETQLMELHTYLAEMVTSQSRCLALCYDPTVPQ